MDKENSIFIGLVSYSNSRFLSAHSCEGLTASLGRELENLGIKTKVQINLKNHFDLSSFELDPRMARESVRAEIQLERVWRNYLNGPNRLREQIRIAGRSVKFRLNRRENSVTTELRRLLNIEYSHVDLYRAAIESGSRWTVILEDDAFASNIRDLAVGLVELTNTQGSAKMVNLSASFTLAEIGVQHLLKLSSENQWIGSSARVVYESERPVTNTVCAIAFRTDFLTKVVADFDAQPPAPVVPIDWKLNSTLMRLFENGEVGPNECLFVEPAPVLQLSMVRDREAN